jgi:hypothetical protein
MGALGGQLLLFALSLVLMQAGLKRRKAAGLFAALPWGILPSLVVSALAFWQIQQGSDPDLQAARAAYNTQVEQWSVQMYPLAGSEVQRLAFKALWTKLFELGPAIEFSLHLGILAAIAVFLRRRYTKAGLLPPAEKITRWIAPWPLAWLVLFPALVWVAKDQDAKMAPWAFPLALNLLVAGLAIFLFQGGVVLVGTLLGWWNNPRTKALVFLMLAGIFASLLFQDGRGLVTVLVMTGLFDPWLNLRRLNIAPKAKKED